MPIRTVGERGGKVLLCTGGHPWSRPPGQSGAEAATTAASSSPAIVVIGSRRVGWTARGDPDTHRRPGRHLPARTGLLTAHHTPHRGCADDDREKLTIQRRVLGLSRRQSHQVRYRHTGRYRLYRDARQARPGRRRATADRRPAHRADLRAGRPVTMVWAIAAARISEFVAPVSTSVVDQGQAATGTAVSQPLGVGRSEWAAQPGQRVSDRNRASTAW
jgi:hypothetical protein